MAQIATITNPLTGQPAQVDQLEHTAQEIDDGIARALPGGAIDQRVSMLPGQNLLDNSVFLPGCLVDQRQGRVVIPNTTYYSDNQLTTSAGTTSAYVTAYRYAKGTASGVSYASFKLEDTDTAPTYYAAPANVVRGYTGTGYGIDRWKIAGQGTLTVDGDGISYTPSTASNLRQMIDGTSLAGKTVTFSALLSSVTGTVSLIVRNNGTGVKNVSTTNSGVVSATVTLPDDLTNLSVEINTPVGSGFRATAAKLELGSQQTLAHQDENGNWVLNEIPDYGEQLRRCQRYFYKTGKVFLTGGADSATKMFFSLDSCNHMRKKPSVSTFTPAYVKGGGIYKASPTVSSVATEGNPDGFYLAVTFGDTGISAYNNVYCYATSLELTADL